MWVRPKYVKLSAHKLPSGETLWTKAGTQMIDSAWKTLRKHIGRRNRKGGTISIRDRVRSAQWVNWNRGEDLWLATGQMLQSLRQA